MRLFTITILALVLMTSTAAIIPMVVDAQANQNNQGGSQGGNTSGQGGSQNTGGVGQGQGTYGVSGPSISLNNPLNNNIVDVEDLAQAILNVLIIIAAPIVVIFIILAGFKYVTAQGDPGKLEEAKKALVYAIIGGILIVGAVAIFEIIVNTINAFRN